MSAIKSSHRLDSSKSQSFSERERKSYYRIGEIEYFCTCDGYPILWEPLHKILLEQEKSHVGIMLAQRSPFSVPQQPMRLIHDIHEDIAIR